MLNHTSGHLTESPPPVWHYPKKYTGGLVLGNLFVAILMRNELFGRLLFLIVNTCFAKVCKKHQKVSFGYSGYSPPPVIPLVGD